MTPEFSLSSPASAWQRTLKMFRHRHVGLIGFAWCALFFFSVVGAASGVLQPVAFGMASSVSSTFLPHDDGGRTNVLLLGVGDRYHAGANLTDSIIIASIEPRTRSIVFLSLPRDLYVVGAPDMPDARINAFYVNARNRFVRGGDTQSGASLKALRATADEIGSRLGTEIHGVIKVDFTAFSEIIDAFGGVDIDVPESLTDYAYPVEKGVIGTFSIKAGPQHLDGDTALKYARSRQSTSDFDRSDRQQQILTALLEKAKAQNPLENLGLVRSVLGVIDKHAEWTLSSGELVALAGSVLSVPQGNIITMHLTTAVGGDYSTAEVGGFVLPPAEDMGAGAILLPYSLTGKLSDWGQIRTFTGLLFARRSLFTEKPVIDIVADPKASLQARRLRNELLRNGFSVSERVVTSAASGSGELTVSSRNSTSAFLSRYLSLPLTMSGSMPQSSLRITLPEEYRFVPFEKTLDM